MNFHYSDFWADPNRQYPPQAWERYFTNRREIPVDIDGLAAGSRAVRNAQRYHRNYELIPAGQTTLNDGFEPGILIAIHKTTPSVWGNYTVPAAALQAENVDFDVIGTSLYPFWDGELQNLLYLLNHLSGTFDVDVAVLEVAWPFTFIDSDGSGNNWSGGATALAALPRIYPVSPQGQIAGVQAGTGAYNQPRWLEFGSGWNVV